MEFKIPEKAEDLELGNGDAKRYVVDSKTDLKRMTDDALLNLIDAVSDRLNANAAALTAHENFDALFSMACEFNDLKEKAKPKFLDVLLNVTAGALHATHELFKHSAGSGKAAPTPAKPRNAKRAADSKGSDDDDDADAAGAGAGAGDLGGEKEQKDALRNAVKMSAYLLALTATHAEKAEKLQAAIKRKGKTVGGAGAKKAAASKASKAGVSKGGFDWARDKERVCSTLLDVVEHDTVCKLWTMSAPGTEFGAVFFSFASLLLENNENMKNKSVRDLVFRLYVLSARRFGLHERSAPALLHVLMNFEHAPAHVADLLRWGYVECDQAVLVHDVAREIGRMGGKVLARDSAGAKNIAAFLPELGMRLPKLTLANLSVLMVHLDNADSYTMRNGLVQLLGALLERAFDPAKTEEGARAERQQRREAEAAGGAVPSVASSASESKAGGRKAQPKRAAKRDAADEEDDDDDDDEDVDEDDSDFGGKKKGGKKRAPAKRKPAKGKKAAEAKEADAKAEAAAAAADAAAAAAAAGQAPKHELSRAMREQRDQLYQLLLERVMDVSSYTRAKVVQTWTDLASGRVIPLKQLPDVVTLAVGRLDDKTALVRKHALTLLSTLLTMNPYGPALNSDDFKRKLQVAGEQFKAMFGDQATALEHAAAEAEHAALKQERKALREQKRVAKANAKANGDAVDDDDDDADEGEDDEDADESIAELSGDDAAEDDSAAAKKAAADKERAQQQALAALVASGEYATRKRQLEYYFDAIRFIEPFERSVHTTVAQLLSSKTSSDVLECIKLLVTANEFQIVNSDLGVRKMLLHIWSKEAPVRDAVMAAYQRLYIGDVDDMGRQPLAYQQRLSLSIAHSLIRLTTGATLAELVSLEELMAHLMRQSQVPPLVVQALWDIFASKRNADKFSQKNSALLLLSMVAGADASVITDHISTVVTNGLSKRTEPGALGPAPVAAAVAAAPSTPVKGGDDKKAVPAAASAAPAMVPLSAVQIARQNHAKLVLARTAAMALQKLNSNTNSNSNSKAGSGSSSSGAVDVQPKMLSTIYARLTAVIRDDWGTDKAWFGAAEQAIGAIFALHPHPATLCTDILKGMAADTLGKPNGANNSYELADRCDSGALAKLFFVVGHVAVKMLVHLESVEARIKALRGSGGGKKPAAKATAAAAPAADEKKAPAKKAAASKGKKKKADDSEDDGEDEDNGSDVDDDGEAADEKAQPAKAKAATAAAAASKAKAKAAADAKEEAGGAAGGEHKQSAIEEELAVNASEEYELEQLREKAERELVAVQGDRHNLLSVFGPLLTRVCSYPHRYADATLQSSSVLALCKLMIVSHAFCDEHLQLLFTILAHARDSKVRANIVISLGDMCFRFPNLLEPWSAHLYSRLRDTDLGVRKNALMVLSHLILNDMLKAKGPVAEIAKCVRDPSAPIADLARLFFSELSKKGKDPIYNLLPDIISRLSRDTGLTTDDFYAVMKFLMAFIDKDKQTEALLEKLCHRFDDQFHLRAAAAGDELEFPTRKQGTKGAAAEAMAAAAAANAADAKDGVACTVAFVPATAIRHAMTGDLVRLELGVMTAAAAAERAATEAAASAAALAASIASASAMLGSGGGSGGSGGLLDAAAAKKPKRTEAQKKADEQQYQLQHWRDIAYCMSQLNCNEKCVRKLLALFKTFQRALHDPEVYACFQDMVAKARKFSSAGMKDALDELEQKLTESHAKRADDERTLSKASASAAAAAKKKAAGGGAAKGKRGGAAGAGRGRARAGRAGDKAAVAAAEPEDDDDDEDEKPADDEDDAEASDDADEEEAPAKGRGKKAAAAPARGRGRGRGAAAKSVAGGRGGKKAAPKKAPAKGKGRGKKKADSEEEDDPSDSEVDNEEDDAEAADSDADDANDAEEEDDKENSRKPAARANAKKAPAKGKAKPAAAAPAKRAAAAAPSKRGRGKAAERKARADSDDDGDDVAELSVDE